VKKLPTDHNKLLERAEKHIFSTALPDAATMLCTANMKHGLAKMHLLQAHLGMEPDATFVASPDQTITRNVGRWGQGISYGGRLCWGNGKEKLVVLDVKPNACGMLVGHMDTMPTPQQLLERIYSLEHEDTYIKGVKVEWDFSKSNHFIDVFKVDKSWVKLKEYVTLIHAGSPEMKKKSSLGPGLYFDENFGLQLQAKRLDTPFGPIFYLVDKSAVEYFKFYKQAEEYAAKRREIAFDHLFDGKMKSNHSHQGMVNMNTVVLGCHDAVDSRGLYPLAHRADVPSYLMRPNKNLTKSQIEMLGFTQRAAELGVTKRLLRANLLPHGGGYSLPDSLRVDKVFHVKKKRFFQLDMEDGLGKKIIRDPRDILFGYRGRGVIERTLELGLGREMARLVPKYILKV
jgi:hypothetical protein